MELQSSIIDTVCLLTLIHVEMIRHDEDGGADEDERTEQRELTQTQTHTHTRRRETVEAGHNLCCEPTPVHRLKCEASDVSIHQLRERV